jgi:uncharacterized protein YbaP (TraB family)
VSFFRADSARVSSRRQFVAAALAAGVCVPFATLHALARWGAVRPLWTARKKGRLIYIVGETLPRASDWHDPAVEGLLGHCGRLWTETNQIFRRPAKALVEQFGTTTDSAPLKLLSRTQMSRLREATTSCGVSFDDLAGMRPWVIGATLEDAFYAKAGLTGKSAREVLLDRATAAGIPLSSEFATKDDVITWMGGFTPTEDAQFLCYEVDGILLGRQGADQMSGAWLAGDTGPAAAFLDHERQTYPELYVTLTVDRNRAWMPRMESMLLDPKPTMVIIGMYHLVGPDNVLTLLRRAGYDVAQEL